MLSTTLLRCTLHVHIHLLPKQSLRSFSISTHPPTITRNDDKVTPTITTLLLSNPTNRNCLSLATLQLLDSHLNNIVHSSQMYKTKALIITHEGPVFSSGHDLKEMSTMTEEQGRLLFETCSKVMTKIATFPIPTVAVIKGLASAAGCQLACSADISIGNSQAKFCTPGVNLGFFCSTPSVALTRVIGRRKAMDMLLTGRVINGDEAKSIGLLTYFINNSDVENEKTMDEFVSNLATSLASKSGEGMHLGKASYNRIEAESDLEASYKIANDAMVDGFVKVDAREGVAAFFEKRTPEWKT